MTREETDALIDKLMETVCKGYPYLDRIHFTTIIRDIRHSINNSISIDDAIDGAKRYKGLIGGFESLSFINPRQHMILSSFIDAELERFRQRTANNG